MVVLYGFLSRLSGGVAGLCAVLALLATPSGGRADQMSDCMYCCGQLNLFGQQWTDCYNACMEGSGQCAMAGGCPQQTCSKSCDAGVYPMCGTGTCDKQKACTDAACKCKIIYISEKADHCECNGAP